MAPHLVFGSGLSNSDGSFFPNLRVPETIPQRQYARTGRREKHESIIFKVDGRLGIPALDAIERTYAGLEGRDGQVFLDKASVIMLRIEVRCVAGREVFGD